MVAAAVIGSAVVGAGASIYGSNKAASQQAKSANKASNVQRQMFEEVRGDLGPYRDIGTGLMPQFMGMLGGPGMDPAQIQAALQNMPGYQFALNQGIRGQQNMLGARGLGLSGAALRSGAQFATGLAEQTYGDQFNRLLQAMTLGQNAAAQTGAYGMQAAGNIGQNMMAAGQAQAAGTLGTANAIGGLAQTGGNLFLTNALLKAQGYGSLFG